MANKAIKYCHKFILLFFDQIKAKYYLIIYE